MKTIAAHFSTEIPEIHGFSTTKLPHEDKQQQEIRKELLLEDTDKRSPPSTLFKQYHLVPSHLYERIFSIKQVHGHQVVSITKTSHPDLVQEGDAIITSLHDTVITIQTADCLPILVTDRKLKIIAAIHAGWRGLHAHIIHHTVKAMGSSPEDLHVWIGPGISWQYFICQQDVIEYFMESTPEPERWLKKTPENQHINLFEIASIHCELLGIRSIVISNYCTYRDSHLFYSYRRDKKKTGRIITAIWQSALS